MKRLDGMRVAVIATDGFEMAELTEPVKALREAGARAEIIAPQAGEIQGYEHHEKAGKVRVDKELSGLRADDYDALLLPGGALNADAIRVQPALKQCLREFDSAKKPIAAICHAPWALISAGLVHGRTLTGYHTIEDDIRNAGGHWVDHAVVCDFNWVTSRQPSDIPEFNKEMINTFAMMAQPASANSR